MMNKIIVTGIVASGKTTFSKEISEILKIPYFELDQIVHVGDVEGRPKRTKEEQMHLIRQINDENQSWIFEGVYRESYHEIFNLAHSIIYMDMPLGIRKRRIITRFIKQRLGIEKCHYRSDFRMLKFMLKWTRDYEVNRADFELFLNRIDKNVIWLRTPKEARGFLENEKSMDSIFE